jgi:hypothetical protein
MHLSDLDRTEILSAQGFFMISVLSLALYTNKIARLRENSAGFLETDAVHIGQRVELESDESDLDGGMSTENEMHLLLFLRSLWNN